MCYSHKKWEIKREVKVFYEGAKLYYYYLGDVYNVKLYIFKYPS